MTGDGTHAQTNSGPHVPAKRFDDFSWRSILRLDGDTTSTASTIVLGVSDFAPRGTDSQSTRSGM